MPVLDQSVSIGAGLVPGLALCPGAGAAERPQEMLYLSFEWIFSQSVREVCSNFRVCWTIIFLDQVLFFKRPN